MCIVVFFLAERAGSTKDPETLIQFGAAWRPLVWRGQWWRLITSMFLHIGFIHIAWNLYMGFRISALVERVLGSWRFLLVYILSGMCGSALSVIGHSAVMAGASGALFGMIGSMIMLTRLSLGSWARVWADPSMRANIMMMALWLAIGPVMHFDSFAHGGGLLAGIVLTWAVAPVSPLKLAVALTGSALLIAGALKPIPGINDQSEDAIELRADVTAR